MLTGRESLLRLIGKRRRYLPNRHNLLAVPTPNSLNLISASENDSRLSDNPISPDDSDSSKSSCRKKRKLTQTTLLQSNLWSMPKQSEDDDHLVTSDSIIISNKFVDVSSSSSSSSSDDIFKTNGEAAIHTFIVGRKFSDVQDLNIGYSISLFRHPDNIKDHNAIKVVSVDSGLYEMLGYLPKDVSQYLSPLIEKYDLKFEGTITSVPKNSSEAVPINVVCQKMATDGWKEFGFGEDFKTLWEKVLEVVEHQMQFPPKTTRYQLNFNLLLQEVLTSWSHLLTSDENTFLESFPLLSEDSQRLFIRLYTRKGPWFRLSNISYPEVSDLIQALEDLTVRGFMSSVKDANELDYQKMKEIIELLNVSELRDILSMNKVKSNYNDSRKNRAMC